MSKYTKINVKTSKTWLNMCKNTSLLPEFNQCISFFPIPPYFGKCEDYTPVFAESCTKWFSRIPICKLKLNYLKGLMYLCNESLAC